MAIMARKIVVPVDNWRNQSGEVSEPSHLPSGIPLSMEKIAAEPYPQQRLQYPSLVLAVATRDARAWRQYRKLGKRGSGDTIHYFPAHGFFEASSFTRMETIRGPCANLDSSTSKTSVQIHFRRWCLAGKPRSERLPREVDITRSRAFGHGSSSLHRRSGEPETGGLLALTSHMSFSSSLTPRIESTA